MEHKCGCNENKDELQDHVCECGDNDEGCGCGHDHGDVEKMVITLNSGEELECSILGTFDVDDNEYIALLPDGSEEVFLYKFNLVDEEPQLALIESDEEYQKVADVFLALCDMGDEE